MPKSEKRCRRSERAMCLFVKLGSFGRDSRPPPGILLMHASPNLLLASHLIDSDGRRLRKPVLGYARKTPERVRPSPRQKRINCHKNCIIWSSYPCPAPQVERHGQSNRLPPAQPTRGARDGGTAALAHCVARSVPSNRLHGPAPRTAAALPPHAARVRPGGLLAREVGNSLARARC